MAYGLRTSAKNRVAVQECRSRAVKTWKELAKEPSNIIANGEISRDNNEDQTEEEEKNLTLIAQLNVDLLLAETANDDIYIDGDEKEKQFLEATKTTLENLISISEDVNINNIQNNSIQEKIIYKHVETEMSIKNILEKIRPDYQEEGEEDFDQYLNDDDIIVGPEREPTIQTDQNLLNSKQAEILEHTKEYFKEKKNSIDGFCQPPKPFKILVHGGPGKT